MTLPKLAMYFFAALLLFLGTFPANATPPGGNRPSGADETYDAAEKALSEFERFEFSGSVEDIFSKQMEWFTAKGDELNNQYNSLIGVSDELDMVVVFRKAYICEIASDKMQNIFNLPAVAKLEPIVIDAMRAELSSSIADTYSEAARLYSLVLSEFKNKFRSSKWIKLCRERLKGTQIKLK